MAEFNLNEIFRQSFGYDAPEPFVIPQSNGRIETSLLGQPFYAEDLSGREFFMPVTIDGYLIPFAVIGMTWKKTIVETPMPEIGGSVNEIISIDDYVFNVKGILLEENFPDQRITEVRDIFKKNASVEMRSVISDIVLGGKYSHRVIIREIDWPAVQGVEHARPFEMKIKSDMIFTLEI